MINLKFILAFVLVINFINFIYISFVFAQIVDLSNYDERDSFIDIANLSVSNTSKNIENNEKSDFLNINDNNLNIEELKSIVLKLDNVSQNNDNLKKSSKGENKKFHYKVKKGDSLWQISKMFKVPLNDILQANNLNKESIIKDGDKLVIPNVRTVARLPSLNSSPTLVGKNVSALTSVGGLLIPSSGFNWGEKHSNNASDISAPCGSEVYAAQKGIVLDTGEGWNSGYGNYILIKHNTNFHTLYAHLQLILVTKGQKVDEGELIGYVGNTGYTVGNSGCHLHFEVRGKINPLLK